MQTSLIMQNAKMSPTGEDWIFASGGLCTSPVGCVPIIEYTQTLIYHNTILCGCLDKPLDGCKFI